MSDDIGEGINTNGTLAIGQSVQSELLGMYDADWFKLTLEAGKAYTFTLGGMGYGGNLYMNQVFLDLMDSTGNVFKATMSSYRGDQLQLSFVAGQSGTYFIGVEPSTTNVSGSYTLAAALQTQAPDDYAPNASTSGVLTVGTPLPAKFETVGDIDWFKFHVDVGHAYNVSFGKDAGLVSTSDFMIYDANGVVQTNYPFEPLASGDCYLSLRGTQAGNYAVAVNQVTDDYTRNNAAPGHLDVGASLSGFIQYRGDVDRFLVQMEEGKVYAFDLSADASVLSHLSVRGSDSDGNSVTVSTLGQANGVSHVVMMAAQSGVYAVDVGTDYYWNGTNIPYTLTSLPAVTDDVGNTIAKATMLNLESSFSGSLDAPSDIDVFGFNVTAGESYVISLASGTSSSIDVNAIDASGARLTLLTRTPNGSHSFIPTETGPYYFQLSTASNAEPAYTIAVHKAVDDFAANTANAGQLSLDHAATGKVDFAWDLDWFAMSLDAGTTYWFNLSSDPASGVSNYGFNSLKVVDASGKVVATKSDYYYGIPTLSFVPATKGTYYVQVEGGQYGNGPGAYQVKAQIGVPDDYGNDRAHAAALTAGTAKSGVLETSGDVDMFKLSTSAGHVYALQTGNYSGSLIVTDASGKQDNLNLVGGGGNLFKATAGGDYYIGLYNASRFTSTYTLTAIDYGIDDIAEDSSTSATLDNNSRAQGVISYPGDNDWFKVHLEAGRSYSFDLLGKGDSSSYGSRGSFSLYDSHSGYSNWNETLGTSSAGGAPHLSYIASKTGDFYIEVRGAALGGYTLVDTVTSTDLTPPALVSMTPASGSSGFGLSSKVVMNFNELITLAPNVKMTLTDSNGRIYYFNFDSTYNSNGVVSGQTVIFDPSFNLQPGMSYTLHTGGAILDMAGNKAAIPDDITFTTVAASTSGTDGDDFFVGSGTGQQIQGGKGIDTVFYDNYPNASHFPSLYKSGNTFYVRNIGVATGDALNGIERVIFSDHAVALDIDGHGGQAYRLYQAAFNRTPDQAGLGFWIAAMDKGVSLQAVAQGFATSAEFQSLYGAAPTDTQYINQLYHNVLHRDGDAAGAAYWQDVLQHGHGRDEVLAAFSESAENQAALIGVIGNGITYIPLA